MTSKPLYLVTGASGFVGRVACRRLRERGVVRALLRRAGDGPWDEVAHADLERDVPLDGSVAGVDTIIHLAGKAHDLAPDDTDSNAYQRLNVEATRRLLQAAGRAGVKKFILLSSVKAMGEGGEAWLNEDAESRPLSAYGRSKRQAEILVLENSRIPHRCVLRSSLVYGSGTKGNIARMIKAMERGLFPPIPRTKNQRSMVHVEDLATAIVLATEKSEANGKVFIVTDGERYSTRQMYEWISQGLHRRVPRWTLPITSLRAAAKIGDGFARILGRPFVFDSNAFEKLMGSACYDSTRICSVLGYQPVHNFKEAVPEMVESVRSPR